MSSQMSDNLSTKILTSRSLDRVCFWCVCARARVRMHTGKKENKKNGEREIVQMHRVHSGTDRGQERVSDALELKLQTVMSSPVDS